MPLAFIRFHRPYQRFSPQVKAKRCLKKEMEENEETNQSIEQVQRKEENPEKEDETNQEEKVIPMNEVKQLQEVMREEKHENEAEAKVEDQTMEEEKVGEKKIDSSKKPKQGPKQNPKPKLTVPQPFSLTTEKRMSRERRSSMDFKEFNPTLSKSPSLNHKVLTQSFGAETTSGFRRANSTSTTKTRLRAKVTTNEQVDKKSENDPKTTGKSRVKEVEKKKQDNAKEREEPDIMLRKSSTFKALPLPTFYHQKDSPPKSETKKPPVPHSKSTLFGPKSKSEAKSEESKTKEMEKKVSRTLSRSTKETISKVIKTTKKSLSTPKEMVRSVVSSA